MASVCISRCVDDVRVPVRATYVNLYKWPESDFEFVRSMSRSKGSGHDRIYGHPRVVDSFSCRQLYLRSYTFSREEDRADDNVKRTAVKCLSRAGKEKKAATAAEDGKRSKNKKKKIPGDRKNCTASCSVLASVYRLLLSCTTYQD